IGTYDYIALIMKFFFREIKLVGLSLNQFNKNKLHATLLTQYLAETDLKNSIEKTLIPFIKNPIGPLVAGFCGTNLVLVTQIGEGGNIGGRTGAGNQLVVPDNDLSTNSKITISSSDLIAAVEFDIIPNSDNFAKFIQPAVVDV